MTERLDAALDRLDELLEDIDEEERRHDVREIQQLVVGARADIDDDAE